MSVLKESDLKMQYGSNDKWPPKILEGIKNGTFVICDDHTQRAAVQSRQEGKSAKLVILRDEPRRQFIQGELVQEQLPSFIQRVSDSGGFVDAVFRSYSDGGIVGLRFSVVYYAFEKIDDIEILN